MRIDRDLLAVASEGLAENPSRMQLDRWVARLPLDVKSEALTRLAGGDPPDRLLDPAAARHVRDLLALV
jgi:hypothetical protein